MRVTKPGDTYRRRGPANDLKTLVRTARAHLKRAKLIGQLIDRRRLFEVERDPDWQPDKNWQDMFALVNTAISQASSAIIRVGEANEKILNRLSDEELTAQWKMELLNVALEFTEHDWALFDHARAKQARLAAKEEQ